MAYKLSFEKKTFVFKRPSGTSRGILTEKHAWFLTVWKDENPAIKGVGECSIIPGLSPEFESFESYEEKLTQFCENPESEDISEWPSILFGWESALLDLKSGGNRLYFDNAFSRGETTLPINGLIWMGDSIFMKEQIQQKLEAGFNCIKMKIGAINFKEELRLLDSIRKDFGPDKIELRVDANGAFSVDTALGKLKDLSRFQLHSIEQPIKAGQWRDMAQLCESTPLAIALDEELIGVYNCQTKSDLLDTIKPQYIILKPSLLGGIKGSQEWIDLAENRDIPWWITSALESNIGLNAISQWTYTLNNPLPQGLGTGQLYTNNISSPLVISNGNLRYDTNLNWETI